MPATTTRNAHTAKSAPKTVAVRALVAEAKTASKAGAARAEALIALILRRKQRITEDFFDIGEALRELLRHKLYLPLGFTSFEQMLDARGLFGRSQAQKLIAIVDAYTREQALSLGLEKAFAVITYAAATPAHEVPQLVLATGINGKPVSALSVRDITAKATAVRAKAGRAKPLTPAEREARAAAAAWQAALRKNGLRDAVATVRHADGGLAIEVRVPAEQVERSVGGKRKRG